MKTSEKSFHLSVRRQRGAFLIEGLIAIAVFSIGISGILLLVGKMVVGSADAQYRVQAAQFAESIISAIRTADPNTRVTDYQTSNSTTSPYYQWKQKIGLAGTGLPLAGAASGTKQLDVQFTNGNLVVVVTITWRAPQDTAASGASGAVHTYVTTTYLV